MLICRHEISITANLPDNSTANPGKLKDSPPDREYKLLKAINYINIQNMKRKQEKRHAALWLLCIALLMASCGRSDNTMSETDYPIYTVQSGDETLQTSSPATIRGRQDIEIYPQVSGKITKVCVTEGQSVRKGQTLFIIDPVPYEAALRVAEANLASAKVGVETAKLDYESTKSLYENKVVSSYEMQTATNALHSAQATLAQMEAEQINAANSLSYTKVTSPADGVVGTLPLREGSLVSATMTTPLTTVSDNSQMYVYFSLNENKLLELAEEYGTIEKALKEMPDVQLLLSNGSTYPHSGRIASISGVISETTGTVSLRTVFPNPDRLLHSGANGSVLVPVHYTGVVTIPQEATFELQDKVLVYKIVDGVTKSSQITVSPVSDGKRYIVTGGLQPGDEIIASGAGLMRDGIRVRPSDETPVQANDSTQI